MPRYVERLTIPWWWWPLAAALVALLGGELWAGLGWVGGVVVYAVVGGLCVGWLLRVNSTRIEVSDDELRAGRAHLPLHLVGEVLPVDRDAVRQLVRRDIQAHVMTRGWIGSAVYVELVDPRDPTPYWLLSTRNPVGLVAALRTHPPSS